MPLGCLQMPLGCLKDSVPPGVRLETAALTPRHASHLYARCRPLPPQWLWPLPGWTLRAGLHPPGQEVNHASLNWNCSRFEGSQPNWIRNTDLVKECHGIDIDDRISTLDLHLPSQSIVHFTHLHRYSGWNHLPQYGPWVFSRLTAAPPTHGRISSLQNMPGSRLQLSFLFLSRVKKLSALFLKCSSVSFFILNVISGDF